MPRRQTAFLAVATLAALAATLVLPAPQVAAEGESRACISPWTSSVNGDYVPVVGDFDGNAIDEILWYGPGDDPDSMWRDRGPGKCWQVIDVTVHGTYRPLVADYDFDGRDDIFWFGPGGDKDALWFGRPPTAATPFRSTSLPLAAESAATATPFAGDFDRNGADDIFFYDPTLTSHPIWYFTSPFSVWPHASSIIIDVENVAAGTGYRPIVGAFGDHARRWILWDRPGDADTHWWGQISRGFFPCATNCPTGVTRTYQALVGDYDGDRDDDIAWYGPGRRRDSYWRVGARPGVDGWTYLPATFRVHGDLQPMVGDFAGLGHDSIWWYAPGETPEQFWANIPGDGDPEQAD